jgi:antitoxin MazE6
MKTAISLPDKLFSEVKRVAKRLGIPRSQLFAKAVEEFIAHNSPADVTARINSVLKDQESRLDAVSTAMQMHTLRRNSPNESW